MGLYASALLARELAALLQRLALAWGLGRGAPAAPAPTQLRLAVPGLTLPLGQAVYMWLALLLSLAVHEVRGACERWPAPRPACPWPLQQPDATHRSSAPLPLPPQAGHALAAGAEEVRVLGAGLALSLFLPVAYVLLEEEGLARLGRWPALRVACAGAWHNAALAALCWAGLAGAAGAGLPAAPRPLALLLGYTGSVSAALGLLNMAPVHYLDGERVVLTLLGCSSAGEGGGGEAPPQQLLPHAHRPAAQQKGPAWSPATRRRAATWVLRLGTAGLVGVVALHCACLRWCAAG